MNTIRPNGIRIGLALTLALALVGCKTDLFTTQDIPEEVKGIAKTSVDYALDAHLNATTGGLEALMRELYRLNPGELAKMPDATVDERVALLLPDRTYDELRFGELNSHRGTEAMQLAFEPRFIGDRVFALMVGIVSQMRIAYNDKLEFFALNRLDSENLENFANNLEIVRSSLKRRTAADGTPLLHHEGEVRLQESGLPEPTVEQILDQIVGHQRVLVTITEGWRSRAHQTAVRTMGAIIMLPIP